MTGICERCYAPVLPEEEFYRLAHIDRALPDGTVEWLYSYVHTSMCLGAAIGHSPIDVRDTGEWNPERRGFSPAAASWIATRQEAARRPEPIEVGSFPSWPCC